MEADKKKEVSMILQLSRQDRMVACSEVEVEVVKKKKKKKILFDIKDIGSE